MRRPRTIIALLLSATLAFASVAAGTQHSHNHSNDDFSWSDNGQSVKLHSTEESGVVVDRAEPKPFHGLQAGDIILAIDSHPVARVGELLKALRDHDTSSATLRVRRAGSEVALTWTHAECQALNLLGQPQPPPPPHS